MTLESKPDVHSVTASQRNLSGCLYTTGLEGFLKPQDQDYLGLLVHGQALELHYPCRAPLPATPGPQPTPPTPGPQPLSLS